MPQRAATIESLPMAFEVVKEMQAGGLDWGEGYRPLGRRALAEIVEGRMAEAVDGWLDGFDGSAVRDQRFRKVRRRTRGGGAPRRTIARTDRSGRNRRIF